MKRGKKGNYKSKWWYRYYRDRMIKGMEPCRLCGIRRKHVSVIGNEGSRLAHIQAHTIAHNNAIDNLTILCGPCDIRVGDQDWTGILRPLCYPPYGC